MNTLELLDKKQQLRSKAEAIITNAEKECRKLNEGEQKEFDKLIREVEDVDVQIRKIEDDNKQTTKAEKSLHTDV